MNKLSIYNMALNLAMPWTAQLADLEIEETVDSCTEYGEVELEENKGTIIL